MLYSLIDALRMNWLDPTAKNAAALRAWMNLPGIKDFPAVAGQLAFLEICERLSKEYERPEWRLDSQKGLWGAQHNFCESRRFSGANVADGGPRVLLVAPLSGHYATLLRDTAAELSRDFEVVITDWRNARDVPANMGRFGLGDYVSWLMAKITEMSENGARPVHMVSVCQPTVPALCAASLLGADGKDNLLASMVMMGGPIDARKSPTAPNNFAMSHSLDWIESNLIFAVPWRFEGRGRLVYPGFLQHFGFVAMNPSRHAKSHHEFFEHLLAGADAAALRHREFYDEYNAVMDLPADYYLETVRLVFQEFALAQGKMEINGLKVEPSAIKKPMVLAIEGELDDISGAGQTMAALELLSGLPAGKKEGVVFEGVGHYGIFAGTKFREVIAPKIKDFIARAHKAAG